MYAYADRVSQQERVISGACAAGMHLVFLLLLVFGINWQRQVEQPANIVDLWTSTAPPKAEPVPAPEPPPPPPPEVKPPPKPVVEAPPKAAPRAVERPDIALKKDKAEKEKRAVEDKQKDAKKREDEAQRAQAEAQRLANEQAEAQRRVAEQAAAAQAKLIAEYKERIRAKIQRLILLPQNIQGNPEAEFDVVLLPDGNQLGVKLKRSSGNPAYDNAVEKAIIKAQPLPLPPDRELFRYFRELNLAFRPQQ